MDMEYTIRFIGVFFFPILFFRATYNWGHSTLYGVNGWLRSCGGLDGSARLLSCTPCWFINERTRVLGRASGIIFCVRRLRVGLCGGVFVFDFGIGWSN